MTSCKQGFECLATKYLRKAVNFSALIPFKNIWKYDFLTTSYAETATEIFLTIMPPTSKQIF